MGVCVCTVYIYLWSPINMVKTNEKVTYRPTDVLDGLAAEENMEPVHPTSSQGYAKCSL